MPLSDDQKAMLRLLARDQSYEDIAALIGLSVDEVVARAQGAVAQLESEGIPAPTLPPAAGSSAPTEQAAAQEPDPVPPPAVKAPEPPPAAKSPEPAPVAPVPPPPPSKPSAPKKPRDKGMLLAIGGGVLAVVVIVVLAILLISGSDGDDSGDTASTGDATAVAEDNGQGRKPTTAQLAAVDGSDASGEATFGRVEESLGLGIKAQGLDPAPQGSIYMVWLSQSPRKMLPLTAVAASKSGRIDASYQVPTEAVVYLATGEFDDLVITRASNKELRASLEQANKAKDFPSYTGDPVLAGQVVGPIIGAAKRLEEKQKEREAE